MKRKLEGILSSEQNLMKLARVSTLLDIAEARGFITTLGHENLHSVDENGRTALHIAASEGYEEVCRLLILINPQLADIIDEDGNTALHLAAFEGHKEVCELLISNMSTYSEGFRQYMHYWYENPIYAVNKNGSTALHLAALKGDTEICELIISINPTLINAVDKKGDTVLHCAAQGGNKKVCELLISNMHVENVIIILLTESINDSPLHKVVGEIATEFIKNTFVGEVVNPIDLNSYQVKLLKIYQVIDRGVIESYLSDENSSLCSINSANNYIAKHYLTLIGVCKSVNEDNPILSLVVNNDCMSYVLSYLKPYSLCPKLFTPVELSGEDSESIYNDEIIKEICTIS